MLVGCTLGTKINAGVHPADSPTSGDGSPCAHGMIGSMPNRNFEHTDFTAEALAAGRQRSVSVCIPARNESATIGPIVATILSHFVRSAGGVDLVDEVVVIDDGSNDATAEVAQRAGAKVVAANGGAGGKGEAMTLAVQASDGDVVLFLDGDVDPFPAHFVTGLLGPVLVDDASLVKASYMRPLNGVPGEGGRVNELVARPIISLLYPELAWIRQPLAGETAIPRTVLDKVRLAPGYGVEIALLIDVASLFGADSIAQVDLGVRTHRNRPLAELRPQAADVLRVALERAGQAGADPAEDR
jgi:glucosyl-3-phosphoglycerate synthase